MSRIKDLFKSWRVILLVIFLVLAAYAIHPSFNEGAAIRSIVANSSALASGMPQPKPDIQPIYRERILSVNNVPVKDADDYYKYISTLNPNRTIQIKTNYGSYRLVTREGKNGARIEDPGLRVYDAPGTNIRKGLDLQGGTRVLLQPEQKQSPEALSLLIDNMKQRLNVYGLSDIVVRDSTDLIGNQYIVVEIAGATEEEIKDLLARQGKFEAKIGNETVFIGGQDIVHVGRSANDIRLECGQGQGGYFCDFSFSITLSQEAAQKFAQITQGLAVVYDPNTKGSYLSEKLDLFLDDALVSSLNIVSDLKGKAETSIAITGAEGGATVAQAKLGAQAEMKRLHTVLITGSLPVKLSIVKTDAISPTLGEEFVKNALLMAALSMLAVAAIISIRYKKAVIAIPILITMLSEVLILLGAAALFGWNMDMAAIAGLLVAIGTGVNDQIVITDETLRGHKDQVYNWKEKVKRAFMIIMLAYFTVLVAMIPLIFAGAGLLTGFAITTITGVTIGVFITRPAYSTFVEIMLK